MVKTQQTFEENADFVQQEIAKRRNRWRLDALADMDFDDVSQLLLLHVYEKWDKWDQKRPLANWVNTVISRRMMNIVRDHYTNVAPPCNDCPKNEGNDRCSFTASGIQDTTCTLYAKWAAKKKDAYYLKLSMSTEDEDYVEGRGASYTGDYDGEVDYEKSANRLHGFMKKELSDYQFSVYKLLYIYGKTDDEVAELMGYTTSEDNRRPGYKQLLNIKKRIKEKVKKIMEKEDVIIG